MDLPLFAKYLAIYHYLGKYVVDCIIFLKKVVFCHFDHKGGKGYYFSMFSVFENRCIVF